MRMHPRTVRALREAKWRSEVTARRNEGRGEERTMSCRILAPIRALAVVLPLICLGFITSSARAADAGPMKVSIDPDASRINAGDTAWMLTSSALVLMM